MSDALVVASAARSDDQRGVLEQILAGGFCPFCPEHLFKHHTQPILRETTHWWFTRSRWPYACTKHHFLIICKQHIESLSDPPLMNDPTIMLEQMDLVAWAIECYNLVGGALFVRFGDPRFNGASVKHLHWHLLQANVDMPGYEKVRVKMG